MDLLLKGRVAVVTGGSRGIGRGIADALAREGVGMAILCRDAGAGQVAADEIAAATGSVARCYATDLADDGSVSHAIGQVSADFGQVDILVNCAALPGTGVEFDNLDTINASRTLGEIDVKVFGCLRIARAVSPGMIERNWGRIINIGGVAAYHSGTLAAGIRTIGVGSVTRNMAEELGPHGITVNCLHPGPVLTDRSRRIVAHLAATRNTTDAEVAAGFAARSIIGRFVEVAEVADIVAFLASPRSAAVNGESIEVSGGSKGFVRY